MDPLGWMAEEVSGLRDAQLFRERRSSALPKPGPRVALDGRVLLNLSSNDYLSLAGRVAAVEAPSGAGASRLICGDLEAHRALEGALARWLGFEDVLLFSSGYAANVGTIAALAGEGSLVVSDALNHASIIDGCRLGRGRVVVSRHGDLAAVERALSDAPESRRMVVVEGYFSMDAEILPLAELRALCDRHRAALYVDEAHALGVWGPEGRGASAAAGIQPDILMGTLGKAFGVGGAFVAGSRALTSFLWNRARSFVFSTALSPQISKTALGALDEVRRGERTTSLQGNARHFRQALTDRGVRLPPRSTGPIVPILLGSPAKALGVSAALLENGILGQAIRPPTVPRETSRLRLAVQAGHTHEELVGAADVVAKVLG